MSVYNPFSVLGIPDNTSIPEAKKAWKRLAQIHHPDKGGSHRVFTELKSAWDAIEDGFKVKAQSRTYDSSFGEYADLAKGFNKGFTKPAPKSSPPPKYPSTHVVKTGYTTKNYITLTVTPEQAKRGCFIPFKHLTHRMEYEVKPNSTAGIYERMITPQAMLGAGIPSHLITINLVVAAEEETKSAFEPKSDTVVTVKLMALALLVGGTITVENHLSQKIQVTVPPGSDPINALRVKGHGKGPAYDRGDLLVKLIPVYKAPSAFDASDKALVSDLVNTLFKS